MQPPSQTTQATGARRESLWADEPVMRDGRLLDAAIRALDAGAAAQSSITTAIASPKPDAWLLDAESEALILLEHIRSMRTALTSGAVS